MIARVHNLVLLDGQRSKIFIVSQHCSMTKYNLPTTSVVLVKKFYFSFSYSKVTEIPSVLVIVTVIPCLHYMFKPCQQSCQIIAKRNADTPKQDIVPS